MGRIAALLATLQTSAGTSDFKNKTHRREKAKEGLCLVEGGQNKLEGGTTPRRPTEGRGHLLVLAQCW